MRVRLKLLWIYLTILSRDQLGAEERALVSPAVCVGSELSSPASIPSFANMWCRTWHDAEVVLQGHTNCMLHGACALASKQSLCRRLACRTHVFASEPEARANQILDVYIYIVGLNHVRLLAVQGHAEADVLACGWAK